MNKRVFYLVVVFLILLYSHATAQLAMTIGNRMNEEKEKFLQNLKAASADSAIVYPLSHYFESEVNSIYTLVGSDASLSAADKEKAIRSLYFFITDLSRTMIERKPGLYDIPGAMETYKRVLKALLYHKPVAPILSSLSSNCTQMMATAFSQYKEYPLMDDIAIYKRVASSPEFILQYVERKPDFRFADSLLLEIAAADPLRVVFYLRNASPGVQDKIRSSQNIYLQEIATLSNDKQVSELLPFITQLAEGTITKEEILEKRKNPLHYFQLLVNTIQDANLANNPDPVFLKPLRAGIKQKAFSFYVSSINELHSSGEAVRFASVKGLRPQDLYYIITTCSEEMYTSSYLGLYKRLMDPFRGGSADSLLDLVRYDNFRIFMRLAATYNVLGDFLHNLSQERMSGLLHQFITGIETDGNTALERAMDIADCFPAVDSTGEVSELIREELQSNLSRCTSTQQYLGIRLYSILSDVFNMVRQKDGIRKLWETLGDYDVLKRKGLENERGEIIQLVLFYGDEDGILSFNNFLRSYNDNSKWKISKNENWVSISSLTDEPLIIYANRPLDIKDGLDLRAQDSLFAFFKDQSLKPTILVHRGHSYHLDKTLNRLTPSVKLAMLGSCGGYNKAISFATISPDVQVIGSKKTGAMSINDPILDKINETLVDKKDILWPELWKEMEDRFRKDETALSLFNEYFPPSNNLGLFVLKLFNYYNRVE